MNNETFTNNGQKLASQVKFYSDYSKFMDNHNRFETWKESTERVKRMHYDKLGHLIRGNDPLEKMIDDAFKSYEKKNILASQRSLQFGGEPILKHESKMYNCLTSYVDRVGFFQEAMYWLLSGCGIGFSVLPKFTNKLPKVTPRTKGVKTFKPNDSIEGWSDALGVLISSFVEENPNAAYYQKPTFPEYQGYRVEFDLSAIRPKGSYISGGFKAPGPEPLRKSLLLIQEMLETELEANDQEPITYRPILVYDTVMFAADAVISGGVRRSATICLFDKTDKEMLTAKTFQNFDPSAGKNSQRARSNNSVLLVKDQTTKEEFDEIFKMVKDWGEPGFVWAESEDVVYNPCLTGDSLIETNKGFISMKELSEMDEGKFNSIQAVTFNEDSQEKEFSKIKSAFKTTVDAEIIKVNFEDGTFIKCTPEHKVYTLNRNWVEAKDLKEEDLIVARHIDSSLLTNNPEKTDFDKRKNWKEVPVTEDGKKPWNLDLHFIESDIPKMVINEMTLLLEVYNAKRKNQSKRNEVVKILSNSTILYLKSIYESGYGLKTIAREFGFTYMQIRGLFKILNIDIRKGRNVVTEKLKEFRSKRVSGTKNPRSYIDSTDHNSISGYYQKKDGSFAWLRSSFEYAFALYLDSINENWGIEDKVLKTTINDIEYTYRPDFFVYDSEGNITKIYEIKSEYNVSGNLEKVENYFPQVEIVYNPHEFINRSYHDVLYEWKEVIKNKQKKITFIERITNEDVYDLSVEGNHNFYANGTLVHNCVEIGMFPSYQIEEDNILKTLQKSLKFKDGEVNVNDWVSGWQGCNLTEINGSKCNTPEEFYDHCKNSSVIGTLQATFTDFKYVSPVSKLIFDKEALLGVSITGWMNNPDVLFDPEIQRKGAEIVKETNKQVAEWLGINQAARTTCVKPSGNASSILETASGIHGEHAPVYFRNMQLNKESDIGKLIQEKFPRIVQESVWSRDKNDIVISFPVIAQEGSLFKKELLGIKQLEFVKLTQQNWIEYGTNVELCVKPYIRHNVSNTIQVDDWNKVRDYIYENREYFAGISLLSMFGDLDYDQAPFVEVINSRQIVDKYGDGALFASGLIVDMLEAFENNLWNACAAGLGYGEKLYYTEDEALEILDEDYEKDPVKTWMNCGVDEDIAKKLIAADEVPSDTKYKQYLEDKLLGDVFQGFKKKDVIRRFRKFAKTYFENDLQKTSYCLKDVYNYHRWKTIETYNFGVIDWEKLDRPNYVDIDTLSSAACYAGACEIN